MRLSKERLKELIKTDTITLKSIIDIRMISEDLLEAFNILTRIRGQVDVIREVASSKVLKKNKEGMKEALQTIDYIAERILENYNEKLEVSCMHCNDLGGNGYDGMRSGPCPCCGMYSHANKKAINRFINYPFS